MEWIDTHTHLYLPQFDEDRAEVMKRCETSGVNRLLLPNIDTDSLDQVDQMVKDYPGRAIPMMGLHPCSVGEDVEEQLSRIGEILFNDPQRFVAVGEIGIDLYWDKSTFEKQVLAFKRQIEWAKELNKPIVIHARDSFDEIFAVLDEVKDPRLFGVFHCFTGTEAQALKAIDLGFYLGIGGVLTFKNGGLDQSLANIPIDHMVLETDSPYLAPVPYRGKRNESSYIPIIGEKLAQLKEIPLDEVAKVTTRNAVKLFSL